MGKGNDSPQGCLPTFANSIIILVMGFRISICARRSLAILVALFLLASTSAVRSEEFWVTPGPDGNPKISLYFFWSLTCQHCLNAHPHVEAMSRELPWLDIHMLELTRHPENAQLFQLQIEQRDLREQAGVPAFLFCGEMHFGWDSAEGMGKLVSERLKSCHERVLAGGQAVVETNAAPPEGRIDIPLFGTIDLAQLSLPALTVLLAGLDAFNPCAFFVLLFLLSMMAHQKSRTRMLIVGCVFVVISGLMYFAFMATWLNVFQLFGHLAWVTMAAGVLAVFVGFLNIKDFFHSGVGPSLSIPESKKSDIFRRARAVLNAENPVAMLAATAFLAVAANFYELLCTAGFPMVYTRLLTLADLTVAGRYFYLAAYNLIYVLPLTAIVIFFAHTLGARKLTEREGRLLKLMSGLMMLGLGAILLLAPERIAQPAIALTLMALAITGTWLAKRLTQD